MQIISGKIRSGKTIKLIDFAHNKKVYIVCATRERCHFVNQLAKELNKNIFMPVSIAELPKMRGCHPSMSFVVDDLEDCFENLVKRKILISSITLDEEHSINDLQATNQYLQNQVDSLQKQISMMKEQHKQELADLVLMQIKEKLEDELPKYI